MYEKSSATLVELSQYQGVEKPTITRTIQQLEKLGLVEQVLSKDKREKKMQLTEYGEKVYLEVRIAVDEFEERILQGLSEKEVEQTTDILSTIRNNLLQ